MVHGTFKPSTSQKNKQTIKAFRSLDEKFFLCECIQATHLLTVANAKCRSEIMIMADVIESVL